MTIIEIIIGITVAILMFMFIIIIHELGHFLAARLFGVKVEEFGIGIPPKAKILGKDKKGTIYTLNWLPLGGFVRLKGEDQEIKDSNDKETFSNKSYFAKSVILLAGVFMNFVLAGIIFSVLFFIGVKPISLNTQIEIDLDVRIIPTVETALKVGFAEKIKGVLLYPLKNSIAEKAGIKQGDILVNVNNKKINSPEDLIKIVGKNAGKEIIFKIKNKLSTEDFSPLKIQVGKDGKIGVGINNIKFNPEFKYKYGFTDSIKYGFLETYYQSILTFKGIGMLAKNIFAPEKPQDRTDAIDNMKGPIGIVDLVAHLTKAGVTIIIILGAIISINLGVFNLLPIPALDGGRFLLISINTAISKILGKQNSLQKTENLLHIIFFIILIALSLIIGYNDIINIINR